MECEVAIVGGGAAGMMAAILLAKHDVNVVLIEKNKKLGKKLLATGNGRCNFTNHHMGKEYYCSGSIDSGNNSSKNFRSLSFIENVLQSFDTNECIALFASFGILSREKEGYVYPYTNQSSTIVETMLKLCIKYGILVLLDEKVDTVIKEDDYTIHTSKRKIYSHQLILATGGKANQSLGGCESGYILSKNLGHHITKLTPSLTSFVCDDACLKEMNGVRIQGKLSLLVDGNLIRSDTGEIQMIKNGVSGIPAFQICHEAGVALEKRKKVVLHIDFVPVLTYDECTEFIKRHSLSGLVNIKCIPSIMKKSNSSLPADIAKAIKEFDILVVDTAGFEKAQVTAGGVKVDEIYSHSMESKITPGLYILGELLDVDGRCGGYNLHFAWASAVLATQNIIGK